MKKLINIILTLSILASQVEEVTTLQQQLLALLVSFLTALLIRFFQWAFPEEAAWAAERADEFQSTLAV